MKVETFGLGMLLTNAYLLYDEASKKGIVMDPGDQPDQLLRRLDELSLQIEAILLTHAHFDHIAGLNELRKKTQAPVYLHEMEADWLEDPLKNGSGRWPDFHPVSCEPAEHLLLGGEQLLFCDESFSVIHTPGHSPGSVTFIHETGVFSGDVLFAGSIGRTDLPGGDYQQLMMSIEKKLLPMSDETVVWPGHGSATTIGEERKSNPFLS